MVENGKINEKKNFVHISINTCYHSFLPCRRDVYQGLSRSNEAPRLFTLHENSQIERTHVKLFNIQTRAEIGPHGYVHTGVPQVNASAHGATDFPPKENIAKQNVPPEGAEGRKNAKTETVRCKTDFTTRIRHLAFVLVPLYLFILFDILCQNIKNISSIFRDRCGTKLPGNVFVDEPRKNRDTIDSIEQKKPKSAQTKLIPRQSFVHSVKDKDKNVPQVQETGNAESKPVPKEKAPGEGAGVEIEQLSRVGTPAILKENTAVNVGKAQQVRKKKILPQSANVYQQYPEENVITADTENHPASKANIVGDTAVWQVSKKNMEEEASESPFPSQQNPRPLPTHICVKINTHLTINDHQTGTYQQRGLKMSKLQRKMYQHRELMIKFQRRKDWQKANTIIKHQRETHMKISKFQREIYQQREVRIWKFLRRMNQQRKLKMSKFQERIQHQRVLRCS